MSNVRFLRFTLLCAVVAVVATGKAFAQLPSVAPQTLTFTYQIGGANPPAQTLFVSAATPTQFAVVVSGASWLTVQPSSGLTPATLTATVTGPANASPGTYTGSVLIGPPASLPAVATVVPVTLQVLAAPGGNLTVAPSSLNFSYQAGGPFPQPAPVTVLSTGSSQSFTLVIGTNDGGSWLSASATSFTTPAQLIVGITPGPAMKPGTYTGTVSVVPASGNSPQVVFVTLQIFSAGNITASPSTLSFIYQSGGQLPSPQVVNVLSSTGAAVPFTVTASTTVGTGWLSYSPTSGSTPTSIVVSVNPGSLGPGTYYGTINILPVGGNVAATQIPVSLTVPSSNQLVASPSNLYFTYQGGGPIPPIQYVSVTSTGAPISFKTTVTGPSWVVASPSSAITPVGVGVQVNPPAGTASGTYTAYITYAPNGPGNTATTTVTITVSAPNYISVSRNTVSFDYSPGGKTPPPAVIPVSSSGGPVHFDVIGSGASWLNVGQTSSTTPGNVVIGVSPQALTPGAYTASVTIVADAADNSPQAINVTLNVTDAALFTASPFALSFAYQIGRTPPPLQAIVIGSAGAALGFSASTSTDSGGSWLLIAGGGVTPATVGVAINTNSLGVGTYTGDVVLTPSDPAGRQLLVPVTLTVSPASVFVPTPAQVSFQYQRGGAAPAPQSVSVNTSSAVSIVYYPTSKTGDGGQWLSVTPATAVTPSPVTISVNPQGLAPRYYYGIVAFSDASGQAPTTWVPVTLQVTDNPVLTVNSQLLFFTSQVGGATPPTQQFTVGSGTATSFHVTPSGGTWLSATPTDGTTNGTVSVVASPATLTDGYYLGTVTVEIPGVDGSQQYVPVIFSVLPRS